MIAILLGIAAGAAEPQPYSSALFLRGFEVEWEKRPHRIRALGFGTSALGIGAAGPHGEHWSVVRGGTWADGGAAVDTPWPSLRYAGLATPERPLYAGTTRIEVEGDRRSAARGQQTVFVPATAETAAVWLRGFRLATDEGHPAGYTIHGLGVELGEPEAVEGGLSFPVSVFIHAAPVPDRAQSLRHYGAVFEVDWLAAPSDRDGRKVHRATSNHQHKSIALVEDGDKVPLRRVPLSWGVDAPSVTAGLTGFRVDVVREGPVDGRYFRGLQVQLADSAYDPVLERWTGETVLRFANAGPITRSLDVEVSATVTTLALAAGELGWEGRWTPEQGASGELRSPYPQAETARRGTTGPSEESR